MDIRKYRKELGLTQKEMALILRIERSTLTRMEINRSSLTVEQLARLIKAMNLNHEYYQKLIFDSIEDE